MPGLFLPPVIVEDNNIQGGYAGKGNFDREPSFAEDGVSGTLLSLQFDSRRGLTTLVAAKPLDQESALEGRVVRIGNRWSAVKEVRGNQIMAWGDLSAGAARNQTFEIIPSYRTR